MEPLAIPAERALFYSPLSFMHRRSAELAGQVNAALADAQRNGELFQTGCLWVRQLAWDSNFFACPTYAIACAVWPQTETDPAGLVADSLRALRAELARRHPRYYLFMELPSEDLPVIQGLGLAGARLIETRLTYYRDDIDAFSWTKRYPVREATPDDIPHLREVAATTRNPFDRLHADPYFGNAVADAYLATFVENSVKGFARVVLVPDGERAPGAFLTGDRIPALDGPAGRSVGRMVLSAVSAARVGWYLRLIAELSYWFKEQNVSLVYMSTQSTNHAVIRTWERLGYSYGRCTHLFATHE